jgi:hypothetical protein
MTQHWHELDPRRARIAGDRFSAVLDCGSPAVGLQQMVIDGEELKAFHPLAPDFAAMSESGSGLERYVRGGDLVVTYPERPAASMRSQLYWRAASHPHDKAIAALELVVSVQTSLLDSSPRFAIRSQLLAAEAFQLVDAERGQFSSIVPPEDDTDPDAIGAPFCYLFRFSGRQYSYAEMVHPGAAQSSKWEGWLHGTEYRLELRHELFADRLEKGVILRGRVLGVLLDRRDDKAAAARHWQSFLAAELPLTT